MKNIMFLQKVTLQLNYWIEITEEKGNDFEIRFKVWNPYKTEIELFLKRFWDWWYKVKVYRVCNFKLSKRERMG